MRRNQTTDIQGNPYLTVQDAKPGVAVKCDGDFTCMAVDSVSVIYSDAAGELYIPCARGAHNLKGQLSDNQKTYVGLYLA